MVASVISINIGKHNIFHRPDVAMLFVMMKACLHWNIFLLFRKFENIILHLYIYIYIYISIFVWHTGENFSFQGAMAWFAYLTIDPHCLHACGGQCISCYIDILILHSQTRYIFKVTYWEGVWFQDVTSWFAYLTIKYWALCQPVLMIYQHPVHNKFVVSTPGQYALCCL